MSDFYNKYPYTDFHELNLDWVIERVKKLTEDWAATLEEWNSTEEQWQELYNYVHDYFDNLDVQQEINNKINAMIADGTFVTITTPVIEAKVASMMPGTVASQIGDTVASQIGATVASQIGATVASQIDGAVVSPVNAWLAANITQPTTPVIDTSLSISGAAADAAAAGNELKGLSGIATSISLMSLLSPFEIQKEAYYWQDVGGVATRSASSNFQSAVINVNPGEVYSISSYLYGISELHQFFAVDDSNNIIYKSDKYTTDTDIQNYIFIIPTGCTKLIVQGSALNNNLLTVLLGGFITDKVYKDMYYSFDMPIVKESKYYIDVSGVATPESSQNFFSSVTDCSIGDVYFLSAAYKGAAEQNPYYVCDNDLNILYYGNKILVDSSVNDMPIIINNPNATKLIVQGTALDGNTITLKKQDSKINLCEYYRNVIYNESMVYGDLDISKENAYYYDNSGVATKGISSNFVTASIPVVYLQENSFSAYETGASQLHSYFYCDDNLNIIKSGTIYDNDTDILNENIIAPFGATILIVQGYALNGHDITIKGHHIPYNKPLADFSYIAFGDSITATSNRWRDEFIKLTGATEVACYAVGGAHLCDYADTVIDGNPTATPHSNTVCNQVQQMLNDPPATVPDFIIISAGTNDAISKTDLDSRELPNIQLNLDEYHSVIPAFVSLADVDRTEMDGAMRWQAEKIWSEYPNTKIIFIAPIQSADNVTRPVWSIIAKGERMKFISNYMSCYTLEAGKECGIWAYYEIDGSNGKYLADGLHPNAAGGILLGKYIASKIMHIFTNTI